MTRRCAAQSPVGTSIDNDVLEKRDAVLLWLGDNGGNLSTTWLMD
jgi:hypothetical protein